MAKHKVFISYHHDNDQWAKESLLTLNEYHRIFTDESVNTGDIDDSLPADTIRTKIRDEYLKDTTVLILLVGTETKKRKHIDWEIYSSMYNGSVNKQSGVLVITLPDSGMDTITIAHGDDEKQLYPSVTWYNASDSYDDIYFNMPSRILANIKNNEAKISVVPWNQIENDPEKLRALIELTFRDRAENKYDLSEPMMKRNR